MFKNTNQSWISMICIPITLTLLFGAWACPPQTVQQRAIAYTELAINTVKALTPIEPALGAATPFLETALAGEKAWVVGQPIPQNVVAALQAGLAKAEQSFGGLTPDQQALIGIAVAAIISALQIAGVVTAPRIGAANPYLGKSPAELKKLFNQKAKAAGVGTV